MDIFSIINAWTPFHSGSSTLSDLTTDIDATIEVLDAEPDAYRAKVETV